MTPKIKNILIFVTIGAALVLIYILFLRPSAPTDSLISSSSTNPAVPNTVSPDQNSVVAKEFLALLLSVKSIKLNDAIFSDNAFTSLQDSSIILVPDGNEGRPNPFAPIGNENVATPTVDTSIVTPSTPTTAPTTIPPTMTPTTTPPTMTPTTTPPATPKTPVAKPPTTTTPKP